MKKITLILCFLTLGMSEIMASTITDKTAIVDLNNKVMTKHQKAVISNENQEQIVAQTVDPELCCQTAYATGECGTEVREFSHEACSTSCYLAGVAAQNGANMHAAAWMWVCTGG